MKLTIQFVGILITLLGIWFIVSPAGIYNWAEEHTGSIVFYVSVIVVRLSMGVLIILAANQSKYPGVIKVFGYLTVFAAMVMIIIGQSGFEDLISSMIPAFKPYAPVSGLMGIALGVFFIYAFTANNQLNQKSG